MARKCRLSVTASSSMALFVVGVSCRMMLDARAANSWPESPPLWIALFVLERGTKLQFRAVEIRPKGADH